MCDPCRDHDRQNRKNKKLREEGRLPPLRSRGKHHSIPQMGSHEPTSSTTENNVLPVAPSNGTLGKAPSAQPDRPLSSSSSSHDVDEVFTDLVDLPDNVSDSENEVALICKSDDRTDSVDFGRSSSSGRASRFFFNDFGKECSELTQRGSC